MNKKVHFLNGGIAGLCIKNDLLHEVSLVTRVPAV